MDPLCTNKLTREKCQTKMKFCCSGGKTEIMIPLLCIRSGDKWLVEQKGRGASLRGTVGVNPLLPPTFGWLFYSLKTKGFEEDPSLRCSLPSTSPPCCLTVTLSGAAKEAHGDCEGEYKSTGLISMGKQVTGTLQTFVIIVHPQRCLNWKMPQTAISLFNLAFLIGVSLLT